MWHNMTNAEASIYEQQVVGASADGMGGTTDQTEWVAVYEATPIVFDPHTMFDWAEIGGSERDLGGEGARASRAIIPPPAHDAVQAGGRVDVTYRGETNGYRFVEARVLTGPGGSTHSHDSHSQARRQVHAEAVLADLEDTVGA